MVVFVLNPNDKAFLYPQSLNISTVLLGCLTFLNPAAGGTSFSYFINRNIFALIQCFPSVRFMAAVSGSVATLPPPVFRLFHVRWMDTRPPC